MTKITIEKWEKTGLTVSIFVIVTSIFVELFANCLTLAYPIIFSLLTGLAGGFIATILVLYLERKHAQRALHNHYIKYQGCYERVEIGQDNTVDLNLDYIRIENIGLFISMTYLGGHEFSLEISYWKSENAKAIGFVEFNPRDKKSGRGNYRYTKGKTYIGHLGTYELIWDGSSNEMIVFYHHRYPRALPFNPDNNRGWEIWRKTEFTKCKSYG